MSMSPEDTDCSLKGSANGHEFAKKSADYITRCNGGERAVAEASLHIMKKFFEKFDQIKGIKNKSFSGSWKL